MLQEREGRQAQFRVAQQDGHRESKANKTTKFIQSPARKESNAALRPPQPSASSAATAINVSPLRSMSAIQLLKYGIEKKIYKTKGWLFKLLVKEGRVL